MTRRTTATGLGLVLLAAVLVTGFFAVLEKRFAEGGLYPHYASYRTDSLGTSVLYESLERLDGLAVRRNLTQLNGIQGLDADSVVLLLGYPRDSFEDLRATPDSPVLKAVEEGARLVITINPELVPEVYQPRLSDDEEDWLDRRRRIRESLGRPGGDGKEAGPETNPSEEKAGKAAKPVSGKDAASEAREEGSEAKEKRSERKDKASEVEKDAKSGTKTEETETEEEKEDEEARLERQMEEQLGPPLTKKLGVEIPTPGAFKRPDEGWETRPQKTKGKATLTGEWPVWRSQYRFKTSDPQWREILYVGKEPVVLERPLGKGTVVLASDTYFASNEGLHLGGEPGFLLWMLGGKTKVIFDETIHGTSESGGAMKLIRRYRAHGVFAGLLLFLVLWAWRSACPLVPGTEEADRGLIGEGGMVLGEGTGSGLIRLLRRSVPSTTLLSRCVEVWGSSSASRVPEKARQGVAQVVERHQRDSKQFGIAEAYAAIVELLRKR
ncbi:MAG: hypothetical protein KDN18_11860 [Verrucomicrobiae bacterium]|nr:hypothetical protein [Verrucomicrobiae bacterium]